MSVGISEAHGWSLLSMARSRALADGDLFHFVQRLFLQIADHLLAEEHGAISIDELSATAQERLRASAKRLLVAELVLVTGMGRGEAQSFVALATTPLMISAQVLDAMERGEVTWALTRRYHEATRRDTVEVATAVATALFGPDPRLAAEERLAQDGETLHGRPWIKAEFDAALARELAAFRDPADAEEVARQVHRERGAHFTALPDGSADLRVTGPLVSLVGGFGRIDRVARSMRRQGDERTLDQLRFDAFVGLMSHGQLPLKDLIGDLADEEPALVGSCSDDLDPAELAAIGALLGAHGPVAVQMIVPLTDLVEPTQVTPTLDDLTDVTHEPGSSPPPPAAPAQMPAGIPKRRAVAEIPGATPMFLPIPLARQLALSPGTTVSRLLVDPADGRCLERSISTYRPDADMRRQLLAADVYSRAPGSRQPATLCDLDHVVPWVAADSSTGDVGEPPTGDAAESPGAVAESSPGGACPGAAGGATSETNLQAVNREAHIFKTLQRWHAAIDDARRVTWTTLLQQHVTTRPHDYRQYLRHRRHLSAEVLDHLTEDERRTIETAEGLAADLYDELQLSSGSWVETQGSTEDAIGRASQVLYALLVARGPGALLDLPEDDPMVPGDTLADVREEGNWGSAPSLDRARRAARRDRIRREERARAGLIPPRTTACDDADGARGTARSVNDETSPETPGQRSGTAGPQVADPAEPQVADPAEPQVAVPAGPQLADPAEPQVAHPAMPTAAASAQPAGLAWLARLGPSTPPPF